MDARGRRILVVAAKERTRDGLARPLRKLGHPVDGAPDDGTALSLLRAGRYGLVIDAARAPGSRRFRLLDAVKRAFPDLPVLVTASDGAVEDAVEAMRRGAAGILRGRAGGARLAVTVRRALATGALTPARALSESGAALADDGDSGRALPLVAELARRLLTAERAAISLQGSEPDARTKLNEACGPCPNARRAARAGPRDSCPLLIQPLEAGGAVLGFLVAVRAPGADAFSPLDRRHAALFALQTAQALRGTRLSRELRAAEDRLLQSEKLNTAGHLAAGLAHEISTPLNIIMSNAEMALEDPRIRDESRVGLEHSLAKARQCRDVAACLLDFVRPQEPRSQRCELHPLLEGALLLARLDSPVPANIARLWPARSPRVRVDPVQIRQIVVNLARNALQATAGRAAPEVTVRVAASGGRVRVSIEDNGPGIAPEHLPRLFQPFFTTRSPGSGTGLGLYLCRLMAERNGGSVGARNAPDGGAIFTLDLPEEAP